MRFFFFYIFQVDLRNKEILYQHNIAEKYYKIRRSELRSEIYLKNVKKKLSHRPPL